MPRPPVPPHRAAGGQQHRAGDDPDAGRRARRDAKSSTRIRATKRWRSRPRIPSGSRCAPSRSSPMRAACQHDRSPWRVVLHRVDDRRIETGGRRVHPHNRRHGGHGRGDRGGIRPGGNSEGRVPVCPGGGSRETASSSASTSTRGGGPPAESPDDRSAKSRKNRSRRCSRVRASRDERGRSAEPCSARSRCGRATPT